MLKRSDVLALFRVAEDSARGRAEQDAVARAGRMSIGHAQYRFPAKEWRAKYLTQWPIGFAGWLWTGAGALSADIVPPSIAPATLNAQGREDTMRRALSDAQLLNDIVLRVVLADDQPSGWDGRPLVALKPRHRMSIIWIDARLRPLLTKLDWYHSNDFTFVAGFDLDKPGRLQALVMPVRI